MSQYEVRKAALINVVVGMGNTLRTWDLNWDRFPNIREWVAKLNLPYGEEAFFRYLDYCAAERAANYWNASRPSDQNAYRNMTAMAADLSGDGYEVPVI